jgi:hypothetical protein
MSQKLYQREPTKSNKLGFRKFFPSSDRPAVAKAKAGTARVKLHVSDPSIQNFLRNFTQDKLMGSPNKIRGKKFAKPEGVDKRRRKCPAFF